MESLARTPHYKCDKARVHVFASSTYGTRGPYTHTRARAQVVVVASDFRRVVEVFATKEPGARLRQRLFS